VLFGTDYPFLTHEQWLRAWETLDIPDDVSEQVLYANAARLLDVTA
jgi:predicted TIM-barrel fold metal-dependent hydrolase